MAITNPSFRNGFYAGAVLTLAAAAYLFQLWQPERQVKLHSLHLVHALEERDWDATAGFLDPDYRDQWGHDRTQVLERLRAVMHYARNLRLRANPSWVELSADQGEWHARITVEGDEGEVNTMIEQHVNAVAEPFVLQWRRRSWKPWDWKLVRVSNSEFQLPAGLPF